MSEILDIYKKTPILEKTREHIIQAGLGCDLASQLLISPETNVEFSRHIDKSLVTAFVIVQAILGFSSRRRKPVQAESADGAHKLGRGATPERVQSGKPWSVIEHPDGRCEIQIKAATEEEARYYRERALAELGKSDGDVVHERMTRENYTLEQPIHLKTSFGGPFQNRAVAKSCFNLLAHVMGTEFVLDAQFDGIREYILEGVTAEDAMLQGKHSVAFDYCMLDPRQIVLEILPPKEHALEHTFQIILDSSEALAYAVVRLFGSIPYTVVLANSYKGPRRSIVLQANPVPRQRRHRIIEVSCDSLKLPTKAEFLERKFDIDPLQQPANELFRDLSECGAELMLEDLTQRAMAPLYALPEGARITAEVIDEVASIAAQEFVNLYPPK